MIVAVTGGKGGVGKSTMAWNLGRELEAVVVDADLATADLPQGRNPDLHDVLAGRATAVDAVEEVSSVALLPSGRTLAGARASDLSDLSAALETLKRQYGRVVVDCPAGLARDVGVVLDGADVAVLVTTPGKSAIRDAMKTRDLARKLGTPIACLAINRAPEGDFSGLVTEIETEFGAPATVIRADPAVRTAQAEWLPIRESEAESDAVERIEWLAARLKACERRTRRRRDGA
nr:P-loop NTPase [Halorhabdus rudnickae]